MYLLHIDSDQRLGRLRGNLVDSLAQALGNFKPSKGDELVSNISFRPILLTNMDLTLGGERN